MLWKDQKMNGDMKISLDKLPIKRLDAIDDSGIERFPQYDQFPNKFPFFPPPNSNIVVFSWFDYIFCIGSEIGPDEKRLSLIRRIDFTPLVEKDAKKKQKSSKETTAAAPWPWQSLVENLQLAHQELSVIIDLINTVRDYLLVDVLCYGLHFHFDIRILLVGGSKWCSNSGLHDKAKAVA